MNDRKNIKKNIDKIINKKLVLVINCWLEQKAVSGMICPATGVEMTMEPGKGLKRHFTNVSKDRILSTRSYSKENLIFTTYGFNSSKCNLSPKGAKAFLRIVKERYGTDEIE